MVFCEAARVNFDLLWNYLEVGVSFLSIRYLKNRAYEESASIEVDPVGIARDSSNETPIFKLFSQRIRRSISYYETIFFSKGNLE
jgi:hypothetical protein